MQRWTLTEILDRLADHYGRPARPKVTDPWLLVLLENVAYLASDERRDQAFAMLKRRVGTRPQQILDAPDETLREIASFGIMPDLRVKKLRACARIALEEF